jgi:hypothetical protein
MGERVANLNFFAAASDQRALLEFLFTSTNARVFESYSELGQELQEFRSVAELSAAFPTGEDKHGNGHAILLQLWSPSVMNQLEIRRIALQPEHCNGHTYRYAIEGGALIQLYFGGVHEKVLTKSHFGHNSEIRARTWGVDRGINWNELKTLSNKIQYHRRKRLTVAKVPGCPVLPEAFELARSGYALKLAAQTPWEYKIQ